MRYKVYDKMTNEIHGFVKTRKRIEVATEGWDGKGYDGEARKFNVWTHEMHPGKAFIHHRKSFDGTKYDIFHEVNFDETVADPDGIEHPTMFFGCWDYEVPYTMVEC